MKNIKNFIIRNLLDRGNNYVHYTRSHDVIAELCADSDNVDCYNIEWNNIDPWSWLAILPQQPQLAKYCDWSNFYNHIWASLLAKAPQFADKCDWKLSR